MARNLFDEVAEYYDVLHDDVDYPGECVLLERIFSRFLHHRPASLLDLGCGTGNHALILARGGCRVTGIDSSSVMLREARAKARGRHRNLEFARADMRRFDLGRTFDAAICMDGGFNHLLSERDILSHFRAVRRHLSPDGVYVFEFAQALNTEAEGPGWIYRESPVRIIWLYDVAFDRRRHRLTAKNRFFAFKGDRIRRSFVNSYSTRVTSVTALRKLLARAGMRLGGVYSSGDHGPGLHPVRKEDPLPLAIARRKSRTG